MRWCRCRWRCRSQSCLSSSGCQPPKTSEFLTLLSPSSQQAESPHSRSPCQKQSWFFPSPPPHPLFPLFQGSSLKPILLLCQSQDSEENTNSVKRGEKQRGEVWNEGGGHLVFTPAPPLLLAAPIPHHPAHHVQGGGAGGGGRVEWAHHPLPASLLVLVLLFLNGGVDDLPLLLSLPLLLLDFLKTRRKLAEIACSIKIIDIR